MTAERDQQDRQDEERRESGRPGGGAGRVDIPGHSGVFPVSAPEWPSGPAEIHDMASWGQGERGAAGYEDHGESEVFHLPPEGEDSPGATIQNPGAGADAPSGPPSR
jgi:hypothetical protein